MKDKRYTAVKIIEIIGEVRRWLNARILEEDDDALLKSYFKLMERVEELVGEEK